MKVIKLPIIHFGRRCKLVAEPQHVVRLVARWHRPIFTANEWSYRHFSLSSRSHKDSRNSVSTVLALSDLPQGLVDGHDLPLEDESTVKQYPTVIRDARSNMQKFEHCVLLTRVGGFYELYFEQAEEYGPLLNIKVAAKKTGVGPVPMAGFPFFQLERFLKILVQDLGRHVAISEEMHSDQTRQIKKGELRDRQVTRVITPGTLIDEQFLNPYDHNYLLAIDFGSSGIIATQQSSLSLESPTVRLENDSEIGLAWLDLSSGDFFSQHSNASTLSSDIARIGPKEVLIPKSMQYSRKETIEKVLKEERLVISYFDPPGKPIHISDWSEVLERDSTVENAINFTDHEVAAVNVLLQYVKKQLPGLKLRLLPPKRQQLAQFMSIDKNSLRGLEVHETIRHNTYKGSLIQAARRTSTESGARLLARRLTSPSTSLEEIQDRLDLVEHFLRRPSVLERTTSLLSRTYDTLRLLQRFSFSKGDADDLLGLAQTIRITRDISNILFSSNEKASCSCISELLKRFHWKEPERIALQISEAIDEEGLSMRQRSQEEIEAKRVADTARSVLDQENADDPDDRLSRRLKSIKNSNKGQDAEEEQTISEDIWVMKRTASYALGRLHDDLERLQKDRTVLSNDLRERIGAASLSLKWTPGLGHICHVKGKDMRISLTNVENARVVSSSKSTRSFYLPEWSSLGAKIENAKSRIKGEEQNIFSQLRDTIIENLVLLRRNATILDEVDVACSFARLASELDLKRPVINHSLVHKVIGGRHLTVEAGLIEDGRHFTPNQCLLNENERIWLITGPNMAGKSTFLRQNALISILAQTGSFIPADYAELGIVDQIFSRVGSADNLSQDQSTFMVEMLETAYILRHATSRSFVIMDEVGRGTTPKDGTAVGFAVLHHLHHVTRCRVLFATHFHDLADMTSDFDKLVRYCTNVVEEPTGAFRFDHRMRKGVNRESHALKVAKLAGMPEETISIAKKLLRELKATGEAKGNGSIRQTAK